MIKKRQPVRLLLRDYDADSFDTGLVSSKKASNLISRLFYQSDEFDSLIFKLFAITVPLQRSAYKHDTYYL